jgi:hypothetical protein
MACQMEDELWLAYLDQVAQREKAAAEAADPGAPTKKAPPASPFVCEEPQSE